MTRLAFAPICTATSEDRSNRTPRSTRSTCCAHGIRPAGRADWQGARRRTLMRWPLHGDASRSAPRTSRSPRRPRRPIGRPSARNSSIFSSASAGASCCPTPPTISPGSSTSARWRGCGTISRAARHRARRDLREPEDHIAILCEVMAGLARGGVRRRDRRAGAFFERHLAPWAGRFFADLETREGRALLPAVGRVGRSSWRSRPRPSRWTSDANGSSAGDIAWRPSDGGAAPKAAASAGAASSCAVAACRRRPPRRRPRRRRGQARPASPGRDRAKARYQEKPRTCRTFDRPTATRRRRRTPPC